MKRIALLTSGGDAPGMNACIRAIVRTAIYNKMEVTGIMRGYDGLIQAEFIRLNASSVANIIQRGGTILKTARSKNFHTAEGMAKAYENIKKKQIEGLIVIGGDGTFRGAWEFMSMYSIPIVGIPGTIDNDLYGTDITIGFDTAINTVVRAIDQIRDTAESHERLFFVEVMGRDAGLIALKSGIGVGAEAILIPETPTNLDRLIERLKNTKRDKKSKIIIVAEGEKAGGAFEIARRVKEKFDHYDTRVSVLGHLQRGGAPTCTDRVTASCMGFAALEALKTGCKGIMVGIKDKQIEYTPLEKATKHISEIDQNLLRMVEVLSL